MDPAFLQFLRNVRLNLRATGPAAILVVWVAAVAVLGLYGKGQLAQSALVILGTVAFALVAALGSGRD